MIYSRENIILRGEINIFFFVKKGFVVYPITFLFLLEQTW